MNKWIRFLLIGVLCFTMTACGSGNGPDQHEGEAKTPLDSSIMERRSYKEVQDEFEERGFTNIKLEKIEDLVSLPGWNPVSGDVEEVLVGGESNYKEDQWVPADTEVVIRYHTYRSGYDSGETESIEQENLQESSQNQ